LAKAKQQRSPEEHLPKSAKRTGKRGIGAHDVDPDDPNVKADSIASETLTQQPLLESAEEAEEETPSVAAVEKGMVLMNFVKTVLTRDKKTNERFVCLNFSALLSPEGAALFCEAINTRYELMIDDDGIPDLHISDCPLQMLDIADAEEGKNVLHEPVTPTKVALAVIEQTGSGESSTGIRLSFTAPIKQRRDVLNWAAEAHGSLVWVKMADQQSKLK
jgi:hypothetical protein